MKTIVEFKRKKIVVGNIIDPQRPLIEYLCLDMDDKDIPAFLDFNYDNAYEFHNEEEAKRWMGFAEKSDPGITEGCSILHVKEKITIEEEK